MDDGKWMTESTSTADDGKWIPWETFEKKEGKAAALIEVKMKTVDARPHPRLPAGCGIEWPNNLQISHEVQAWSTKSGTDSELQYGRKRGCE